MSSNYWGIDDLDILASDLDTSLSGLGGATTVATPFDMSETLSVLQVLKTNNESERSETKSPLFSTPKHHLSLERKAFPNGRHTAKVIKKPCRKSVLKAKLEQNRARSTVLSSESQMEEEGEGSLQRVASAPSLSQSLYKTTSHAGMLLKQNSEDETGFQYVLVAPTALGTKVGEETLTYLNQGQSYEIRLKKLSDLSSVKGKLLKSVVKTGFQERRLQFREKLEFFAWQNQRPSERILDIDLPLSYGIFEVKSSDKDINRIEFVWDPSREASVFFKINCISTEFTSKRKGGEKGVAFRILIDTYNQHEDAPTKLHTTSCLVKVFKAKGADRKHKTDREKLEKLTQSEQCEMQPSYQYTVFIQSFSNELEPCHDFVPIADSSFSSERNVIFDFQSPAESSNSSQSFVTQDARVQFQEGKEEKKEFIAPIHVNSTPTHVCNWLAYHRFSKYLSHFSSFNGADLMRLSREDLVDICGLPDGIRFYNSLYMRPLRPKLMLYVSSECQTFRAVCLYEVSWKELSKEICDICHLHEEKVKELFVQGPSGILIHLCDKLLKTFKNESVYILELGRADDEDKYCVVLQPYSNTQVVPESSFGPTNDSNITLIS